MRLYLLLNAIFAVTEKRKETVKTCVEGLALGHIKSSSSASTDITAEILSGELDTFEEMYPLSFSSQNCDTDAGKEISNVIESLTSFVSSLKTYIHETSFDVQKFESQGSQLERRLSNIEQAAQKVLNDNEIDKRLHFAQYMFRVMGEAIELMKHYGNLEAPGHTILWSIVDLNVRLLRLVRPDGSTEDNNEHFLTNVYIFGRQLEKIKRKFKASKNIPFGAILVFNAQLTRADYTLRVMAQDAISVLKKIMFEPPKEEPGNDRF